MSNSKHLTPVRYVSKGKRSSMYMRWNNMRNRCSDIKAKGYKNYGGRGIKVCPEWQSSYEAFCRDMGPIPDGAVLDRIDVNGDYEPSNCRWVNNSISQFNKRKSDRNTSGFTGVYHRREINQWGYKIQENGVMLSNSSKYKSALEANNARIEWMVNNRPDLLEYATTLTIVQDISSPEE